ncbi:amidohydrolase family protein [Streptantibioticus silvisoli]|uniref:Amidohydrolase family protein n=1 Tax=Streptantibioticus silvisoli TaxID=2705255 RepID=A0ABT6VSR8_9ACTN|nr:amidohydrolase family protein [Streptantibioticus silvisoli]MDI5961225.1 amidohydrolase family protein [Streptantibioticus silvisoli]
MGKNPTTLIRDAIVLSMDAEIGDLPRGQVLVEGKRIAAVGRDLGPVVADRVIDANGGIVIPGFVDTHRHMWEAILRGYAARDTLEGYFERILFGIGPELTPRDLAVSEALSARAALDAGITTVQDTSDINETPARTDAIVAALQESGLRAVFAYGLSRPYVSRHGSGFPDDVRRVRAQLLPDDDALVTMALETQNGDDAAERRNAALARELDVLTAHHVRSSIRPSRLRELGALRPRTTFVHGNGLDADELAVIADSGGSLSIAPVVEQAMGLGNPMITQALAVPGLPVCLSVDVEVTSPTDMFSQMRSLYLAARSASTTSGPTVRDILRFATLDGARALGLDGRVGSITPGKEADLLLLRTDRADAFPVTDPYGAVVLQMDRSHVDTVLVAGTAHKLDGRPTRDDTALIDTARGTIRRLTRAGVLDGFAA